jgi:hypothetical protein
LIDLRGKVRIYNLLGLELINYTSDILTMNLINRKDDVSFIETYNYVPKNNIDIVLAKGRRISVTNDEVVFRKLGDTITDNSSPNQLKLQFDTDLTSFNKTTSRQSIIDHTSINNSHFNLYDKIINEKSFLIQ